MLCSQHVPAVGAGLWCCVWLRSRGQGHSITTEAKIAVTLQPLPLEPGLGGAFSLPALCYVPQMGAPGALQGKGPLQRTRWRDGAGSPIRTPAVCAAPQVPSSHLPSARETVWKCKSPYCPLLLSAAAVSPHLMPKKPQVLAVDLVTLPTCVPPALLPRGSGPGSSWQALLPRHCTGFLSPEAACLCVLTACALRWVQPPHEDGALCVAFAVVLKGL